MADIVNRFKSATQPLCRVSREQLAGFFTPPELEPEDTFPEDFIAAEQLDEFRGIVQKIETLAEQGQLGACFFGEADASYDAHAVGEQPLVKLKIKLASGLKIEDRIAYEVPRDFAAKFKIADFDKRPEDQCYWVIGYIDSKTKQVTTRAIKEQVSEACLARWQAEMEVIFADIDSSLDAIEARRAANPSEPAPG